MDKEQLIPESLRDRVKYGVYGGHEQYYIEGVDGTLAQLGQKLPAEDRLRACVEKADKDMRRMMRAYYKRYPERKPKAVRRKPTTP